MVQRRRHVHVADAEGLPQDRPALPGDQAGEDEQDGRGASAQPDGANRLPSNLHHEPPLRKREEGKPSLFRSGAKSLPSFYLTTPGHFPSSIFPLPSSLSYRLLVRRSHTSTRDIPTSSHARNSLIRYVSVPSKIWVGSAHSPRSPRSGLT